MLRYVDYRLSQSNVRVLRLGLKFYILYICNAKTRPSHNTSLTRTIIGEKEYTNKISRSLLAHTFPLLHPVSPP